MFEVAKCGCVASEQPRGGIQIDFCPLHAAAPSLLAALKATVALLQEAGEIIVSDPGHNVGLAASIELVYRKAHMTILKAEGQS